MRDSFVRALTELTAEDPSIVLITGDLGFGVLADFMARYPGNYINAGVAEQNMTAVACGMALAGARAYTYSIGNFPTLRCLEQLRNDRVVMDGVRYEEGHFAANAGARNDHRASWIELCLDENVRFKHRRFETEEAIDRLSDRVDSGGARRLHIGATLPPIVGAQPATSAREQR